MLTEDLHKYPIDAIEKAIRVHRENNVFWPDLGDLMPEIKKHLCTEEEIWDQRLWAYFRIGDHHWQFSYGPEPGKPGCQAPKHIVDRWIEWKESQC